jgi:transcriptional regulator with XRE-family HTH domain
MQTVGDRVREIREERGEQQPEFAASMTKAAKELGIAETYNNTMVSKMETGGRKVTLEDARVIARLDRKKRGRSWLAWGDATEEQKVPKGTKTGLQPYPTKAVEVATDELQKRRRGRGR